MSEGVELLVGLELSFNDEQVALQQSVAGICEQEGLGPLYAVDDPLPHGFWRRIAEIGVLGLGTVEGGGGVLEIAAAMETLGSFGAPGPLVGTFTAGALLDADQFRGIASGEELVSVGSGSVFPWAPRAAHFIELDYDEAHLVEPGEIEELETTAGEPWGRVRPTRIESLGSGVAASARAEVAIAAYLVGAADRLLSDSAEYACDRKQFGKQIATFQAVSHPLAQLSTRVTASRILCRGAAQRLQDDASHAASAASTARVSAVASANEMAYLAHQILGAMGFTLEGPVAHLSHRIRQFGLLPPLLADSRERVLDGVPALSRR
jgi:alkylation response protein AidB-like acyl-CoA dehydrogenase